LYCVNYCVKFSSSVIDCFSKRAPWVNCQNSDGKRAVVGAGFCTWMVNVPPLSIAAGLASALLGNAL